MLILWPLLIIVGDYCSFNPRCNYDLQLSALLKGFLFYFLLLVKVHAVIYYIHRRLTDNSRCGFFFNMKINLFILQVT